MGYVEDLQTLRLLKAFSKIADHETRRGIIEHVEAQVEVQVPGKPARNGRDPDVERPTEGRET